MTTQPLRIETDARGVCTVTLDRPDLHNAFDDALIKTLTMTFREMRHKPEVRVVVLAGSGKSFSAGADLNWMKRMADYTQAENFDDAMALAEMLRAIYECPKPVIARVHGAAFGGGVGLVAACDIAIAAERASFCLSEVKLGLIPAAISPYVMESMTVRAARRYFLTAERFDAAEAHRIGLVHEVVADDALDAKVEEVIGALLMAGPAAQGAAKELIAAVAHKPIDREVLRDTAERIAEIRVSDEGQEGLEAFLGKRKPAWVGD